MNNGFKLDLMKSISEAIKPNGNAGKENAKYQNCEGLEDEIETNGASLSGNQK
jgi:hypothetical protein